MKGISEREFETGASKTGRLGVQIGNNAFRVCAEIRILGKAGSFCVLNPMKRENI